MCREINSPVKHESDSSHPNPPSWPEHSSRHSYWRGHYMRGQRPPWWPENEEWPPTRDAWRRVGSRNPFFRRIGCFFFAFSFLAFMGLFAILRLIFTAFHGAPPFDQPGTIIPFG